MADQKRRKMEAPARKRRVGIVGYGKLGQYLVDAITAPENKEHLEIAFIWNRSPEKVTSAGHGAHLLEKLEDAADRTPDLIIEVAHPSITVEHGVRFVQTADYMVGSPTVFADANVEAAMRTGLTTTTNGLYIPSGALWGATDLLKMGQRGTLKALKVTMKKHPDSIKCFGDLVPINDKAKLAGPGETVLYDGPVRKLCPMAPNNVNTIAAAALAAPDLGFDGVVGCLVADTSLDAHVIEISAVGPGNPAFTVHTVRFNPAQPGAVTGNATYDSFVSSMCRARGQGAGLHFC